MMHCKARPLTCGPHGPRRRRAAAFTLAATLILAGAPEGRAQPVEPPPEQVIPAPQPQPCQAPDPYLTPKVPLRRTADALRAGKEVRLLVFSTVRSAAIPAEVEAKRYPASFGPALTALYPGHAITVTSHTGPSASITDGLGILKAMLAEHPYELVIWQLGASDVLRGTDLSLFAGTLGEGIEQIHAHRADAVLMSMQYSPRTDFMFDATPYLQYLKWVAKTEGAALFNRYDIMRSWEEDDRFDLSGLQPGASVFENVHRCVGQLLARFIANGIAASE